MLTLRVSVVCLNAFRADAVVALFAIPPVLVLFKLAAATPRALDASLLRVSRRLALRSIKEMAGLALRAVDAKCERALLDALISGLRADILLTRIAD